MKICFADRALILEMSTSTGRGTTPLHGRATGGPGSGGMVVVVVEVVVEVVVDVEVVVEVVVDVEVVVVVEDAS